jgi:hypothetical protein
VIEQSRFNTKGWFLYQDAIEGTFLLFACLKETVFAEVSSCSASFLVHLRHFQLEIVRIFVHQVPRVARELSLHSFKKTGRPEKMKLFFTAQRDPEQGVESDEMIHMGVSHKNVLDLEQFSRRKGVKIPKIKEDGFPLIQEGNEKTRIVKGRIHEPCCEGWLGHRLLMFSLSLLR